MNYHQAYYKHGTLFELEPVEAAIRSALAPLTQKATTHDYDFPSMIDRTSNIWVNIEIGDRCKLSLIVASTTPQLPQDLGKSINKIVADNGLKEVKL